MNRDGDGRRPRPGILWTGAVLLCALVTLCPAPAGEASGGGTGKVVIVSLAGVTWEDVAAGRAPTLRALGERWSMGALSIRTVDSPTDPASAFATIGAGNRARGSGHGGTPSWGSVKADNARLRFGAVPGALGETLREHGLRTGVVSGAGDPAPGPATMALADAAGHVDLAGAAGETREVLSSTDVALVELSRARGTGDIASDDAALGAIVQDLDLARTTLLVLGTSDRDAASTERLMVAVAAGAGIRQRGWLTSPTTHRDGLVTLQDVAPAVLRMLGIDPPSSMTGQALRSVPASGNRLQPLLGLQRAAAAYGRRVAVFIAALGLLGVGVFLIGWRRLRLREDGPAPSLTAAALAVTAAPLACLIQAAAGAERWDAWPAFAFLAAATTAVVAAAMAGPWRRSPLGPPIAVASLTAAAIAADLATGSRGQLTSLIGYSPVVGGRFYGLSAVSFAVLGTYALVLAGMLAAALPRHRILAAAGVGAVTVAVAGAPMLGAKFGSILTLVPAFGLLLVLVGGRRLSLARVAVLAGAGAAIALGIGLVDALRPAQSQTHIGRFVAALLGGGGGSVGDVIARKVDTNLGIFVRAPVALLVPAALVLVAVVTLRPPAWLAGPLERVPGLRAGLLAAIAANALGLLVNDSGPAIPAMGLVVGVPLAIALLVASGNSGPRAAPSQTQARIHIPSTRDER